MYFYKKKDSLIKLYAHLCWAKLNVSPYVDSDIINLRPNLLIDH